MPHDLLTVALVAFAAGAAGGVSATLTTAGLLVWGVPRLWRLAFVGKNR